MSPVIKCLSMVRVLSTNPNSDLVCSDAVSAALARLHFAASPTLEVATLAEGPPAICGWRDWRAEVESMCRTVEREAHLTCAVIGSYHCAATLYVLSRTEPHRRALQPGRLR
jgi:hypothetical protein